MTLILAGVTKNKVVICADQRTTTPSTGMQKDDFLKLRKVGGSCLAVSGNNFKSVEQIEAFIACCSDELSLNSPENTYHAASIILHTAKKFFKGTPDIKLCLLIAGIDFDTSGNELPQIYRAWFGPDRPTQIDSYPFHDKMVAAGTEEPKTLNYPIKRNVRELTSHMKNIIRNYNKINPEIGLPKSRALISSAGIIISKLE